MRMNDQDIIIIGDQRYIHAGSSLADDRLGRRKMVVYFSKAERPRVCQGLLVNDLCP